MQWNSDLLHEKKYTKSSIGISEELDFLDFNMQMNKKSWILKDFDLNFDDFSTIFLGLVCQGYAKLSGFPDILIKY